MLPGYPAGVAATPPPYPTPGTRTPRDAETPEVHRARAAVSRALSGRGERLGRQGQVHHQQPEVRRGRGAGRGRPRCG